MRTVRLLLFLFLLSAIGCHATDGDSIAEQSRDLLAAAKRDQDPQKVIQARELLERAHRENPANDAVLVAMGDFYYQLCSINSLPLRPPDCAARQNLARDFFEKAGQLNPRNAEAFFGLGHFYESSDPPRAIENYRRGLALDPSHLLNAVSLGSCLFRQQRIEEAETIFRDVLARSENSPDELHARAAREWLGRVYTAKGQFELAEQTLRQSAEGLEEFNEKYKMYCGCPYQALGELYARLGLPERIVASYIKAADLESVKAPPQYMAAYACYVAGDYDRADRYIDRALAIDRQADYLVLKGHLRLMQKQYADADRHFRDALTLAPSHLGAQVGLGHLSIIEKKYEQAAAQLTPALALVDRFAGVADLWADPRVLIEWFNYQMACLGLGWAMANQNRHREAIAYYDRVLQYQVFDLMALLGKGNSLSGLKQLDEAERLFTRVLEKYPDNQYALAELAIVKYNRGDNAGAEAAFQKALAQGDTRYTCPYEGLGLVYLRAGKLAEAKTNFEKAIAINPDIEYKKFNGLAKIYLREGKIEEAEKLLRKSIANYPYDNEATELLAELERKKNVP